MNKKLTAFLTILVCMFLDSIVFAQINLLDIRPDAMLAATVSYAVLTGSLSGAVFGGIGGLLMDVMFGRSLGLYAALYMVAGMIAGYFHQKFYADNLIVPAAAAAVAGLTKDIMLAILMFLSGTRFGFAGILLRYILPSALMSGGFCAIIHLALKPQMMRQIKRRQADHIFH